MALALREIGRIERTLFIIDWLLDADMQRRAQIGLNKGAAHHALKNALRIGRQGEIRDRFGDAAHQYTAARVIYIRKRAWRTASGAPTIPKGVPNGECRVRLRIVVLVSADFKQKDAESYDGVAADFDKLAQLYATVPARALAQTIDAAARRQVIDMGCGTGLLAFEVAAASGPETAITGIDLSQGMLAEASARAKAAGLSDRVHFRVGDAEALDLPDDHADGLVSLYAFSHFPNPEKAAAEAFRVLAPGGRIAVAIGSGPPLLTGKGLMRVGVALRRKWSEMRGREVTACDQIDRLVGQHLPTVPDGKVADWAAGQRDVTGLLDRLLQTAGFTDCRRDWVGTDYSVPDIETFWTLQTTISTRARKHIAAANEAQNARLKNAFWAECEAVLQQQGRLTYRVGAAIISARKFG